MYENIKMFVVFNSPLVVLLGLYLLDRFITGA